MAFWLSTTAPTDAFSLCTKGLTAVISIDSLSDPTSSGTSTRALWSTCRTIPGRLADLKPCNSTVRS